MKNKAMPTAHYIKKNFKTYIFISLSILPNFNSEFKTIFLKVLFNSTL